MHVTLKSKEEILCLATAHDNFNYMYAGIDIFCYL